MKVNYSVFLHSSKESVLSAVQDAYPELTDEELMKFPGLAYVGYEEEFRITFDTETGRVTVKPPQEYTFNART